MLSATVQPFTHPVGLATWQMHRSFVSPPSLAVPARAPSPRLLLVEGGSASTTLFNLLADRYQVEMACDGLVAWHLAQRHAPAMVIIDLPTVGSSSLALIQALRAREATTAISIILLATGTHRDLLLRCLGAGANYFLLKPCENAELFADIRLALQTPVRASDQTGGCR